jgi:hypothetical protein
MILSALQAAEFAESEVLDAMRANLNIVKAICQADMTDMATHQQAILFASIAKFIVVQPSNSQEQIKLA